jgi:hypothetical protein
MPGLKLYDYEEAYVQITEDGKKYYLKEYNAELAKKITVYDEKVSKGERPAMEMQLNILTGIPKEELTKLAQWKLNEISKFCVEMNVGRKKKEKKRKKSG